MYVCHRFCVSLVLRSCFNVVCCLFAVGRCCFGLYSIVFFVCLSFLMVCLLLLLPAVFVFHVCWLPVKLYLFADVLRFVVSCHTCYT